eukprot:scaffold19731_cov133-Isochrysis_galbana.AAC.5
MDSLFVLGGYGHILAAGRRRPLLRRGIQRTITAGVHTVRLPPVSLSLRCGIAYRVAQSTANVQQGAILIRSPPGLGRARDKSNLRVVKSSDERVVQARAKVSTLELGTRASLMAPHQRAQAIDAHFERVSGHALASSPRAPIFRTDMSERHLRPGLISGGAMRRVLRGPGGPDTVLPRGRL